jgi:hypothetical protein
MKQQSKLKEIWKSKGFFVINLIRITPIGLPDLICIRPDKVVFVESKEKTDRLSQLQKVWLNRLSVMGFECYVNEEKYLPHKK